MKYTASLKYLLVACDENSAKDLKDVEPDISAAFKSCQDGSLVGVIVTLQEGMLSVLHVLHFYPVNPTSALVSLT